jgi:hypothetical protein
MIRDVLDELSPQDRRLLTYALDHDIGQVIKLPDKKFVGINIQPCENMIVLERVGDWCYGKYL